MRDTRPALQLLQLLLAVLAVLLAAAAAADVSGVADTRAPGGPAPLDDQGLGQGHARGHPASRRVRSAEEASVTDGAGRQPADAHEESRVNDGAENDLGDLEDNVDEGNATAHAVNATDSEKAPRARHGHNHVHDGKAGCFGWRPVYVLYTTTTTESSDSDSDSDSERLRAAPRRRRGRSRGRREALPAGAASRLLKALLPEEGSPRSQPAGPAARDRRRAEPESEETVNELEDDVKTSILDFSIKDLVKRCVDTVLGRAGGGGSGNSAGVTIAKEGIAAGRQAIAGGVEVAKMIVQAFRELGASSSSLVTNVDPAALAQAAAEVDAAAEGGRPKRDAITNVKKNLKNKSDVIMSRANDVTETVNDRMDSVFGENKVYLKAKEMVMTAVGKVLQTAMKVSSRRRRGAEPMGSTSPSRPRKGKEAILARVMADLDNMPGRRIAKIVAPEKEQVTEDGVEEGAGLSAGEAQGEAADMLAGKRTRRAAEAASAASPSPAVETTTSEADWASSEEAVDPASAAQPQDGSQRDIGAELGGSRRRRGAGAEAVRLRRDVMEDIRNATERLVQQWKAMVMKARQMIEEATGRKGGPPADGGAGQAKEDDNGMPVMPTVPPELMAKVGNMTHGLMNSTREMWMKAKQAVEEAMKKYRAGGGPPSQPGAAEDKPGAPPMESKTEEMGEGEAAAMRERRSPTSEQQDTPKEDYYTDSIHVNAIRSENRGVA